MRFDLSLRIRKIRGQIEGSFSSMNGETLMLTDSKIRATKPLEKSYKLTDTQGLYLTVSTSGSKLWYFRYRFEGEEILWPLALSIDYAGGSPRKARCGA